MYSLFCMYLENRQEPTSTVGIFVYNSKITNSNVRCAQIFTLPSLKPLCKLKLTAGEGARVRRTALAQFKAAPAHVETCLLCLTNLGDVIVLSLPELKRQINAAVIRREDIKSVLEL